MPSLSSFYLIPRATNSLEFIGELIDKGFSVTQGLGGSMELSEDQLGLRYQSFCNPWLNFEHGLGNSVPLSFLKGMKHVALLLANYFKDARWKKIEFLKSWHHVSSAILSIGYSY
ncbi:hypothetical protein F5146DRAFT_972159 [Armillaria mellea]|nr:hypothetical protein F5146DRAFT_972159 [Armillaria mellea]